MKKFSIRDLFKIRKFRYFLYKRRLKSCGNLVNFASGIKLLSAKNISIGNNVKIGNQCLFMGHGGITVGNNVSFGPQVVIWTSNHNYYSPEELPYDSTMFLKPVTIKDNAWIGTRSCIIPGVTIEEGAVVAMGAVVTKDVPKGAVVAGNPARIIKYRDLEKYEQLKKENKIRIDL